MSPLWFGTVTRPFLTGCLSWICEPFCSQVNQPSFRKSFKTSLTVTVKVYVCFIRMSRDFSKILVIEAVPKTEVLEQPRLFFRLFPGIRPGLGGRPRSAFRFLKCSILSSNHHRLFVKNMLRFFEDFERRVCRPETASAAMPLTPSRVAP